MFKKQKSVISSGMWKTKNPHSLENLKYLYAVLGKNEKVTESNRHLLVETLRSISEILIWGDQNDSSVFDFFLEKNMLAFFLRFMRQKSGRFICVQLLQTLNILFENISNETSVYYLLSNNHINAIIVHKFDFSDEEVMAYYISFLKTLSLKLNKHTIHFFYNEHTHDFALYTEAIKFFNHSESMVRIAVRTITLNVFRVDDKSMLRYIRDKTAAPYFTNLVWFIGNHILELDSCVRNDVDHHSKDRLADLVAEHLDHLHYINDMLCLNIEALNEVLTDHLLHRLLLPLYVYSIGKPQVDRPHVESVVALFLLSQVFLILSHQPLVRQLANIIFNGEYNTFSVDHVTQGSLTCMFVRPEESLAQTLDSRRSTPVHKATKRQSSSKDASKDVPKTQPADEIEPSIMNDGQIQGNSRFYDLEKSNSTPESSQATVYNSTDEEKLASVNSEFSLQNRPYLQSVFSALDCKENDYNTLFVLCLLYALGHNEGICQDLLDSVFMTSDKSKTKETYNVLLVEKLIDIITLSCRNVSPVRLATLEMSCLLLRQLVLAPGSCYLQDRHLAAIEGAREESTLLLRNFYKVWEKSEEIFLDMFEDEYREMEMRPLNVEYLTMDASILLPPTGTPLTGIHFTKRLPCGEVERARRAIRVFFLIRSLSVSLRQDREKELPLTRQDECIKVKDVLDLNNSDLIACLVITNPSTPNPKKERRFLVIDVLQLILVEPDARRLGWGIVKFVGFLQDVEVAGDKDDSRSLHVTIHKPSVNIHANPVPLLSARFTFDDHIRCMAAKQRLTKGRLKARQKKMQMIARILELPASIVDPIYQAPPSVGHNSASLLRVNAPGSNKSSRTSLSPRRTAFSSGSSHLRAGGAVRQPTTILRQVSKQLEESSTQISTAVNAESASVEPAVDALQSSDENTNNSSSKRSRVVSGPPASLVPAPMAPVSLVVEDSLVGGSSHSAGESPTLLPPTDSERIRSLSDPPFMITSVAEACPLKSQTNNRIPLVEPTEVTAGLQHVDQSVEGPDSASNELARLSHLPTSRLSQSPKSLETDLEMKVVTGMDLSNITDISTDTDGQITNVHQSRDVELDTISPVTGDTDLVGSQAENVELQKTNDSESFTPKDCEFTTTEFIDSEPVTKSVIDETAT